jgi:quinol monooxygenase YgiN
VKNPNRVFIPDRVNADVKKPVTVIVRVKVAPGAGAEYEAIALQLAGEVRAKETGCLVFAVQRVMGHNDSYVVVARFASAEALEAHWASDHLRRATERGYLIADGAPEVEIFQDV